MGGRSGGRKRREWPEKSKWGHIRKVYYKATSEPRAWPVAFLLHHTQRRCSRGESLGGGGGSSILGQWLVAGLGSAGQIRDKGAISPVPCLQLRCRFKVGSLGQFLARHNYRGICQGPGPTTASYICPGCQDCRVQFIGSQAKDTGMTGNCLAFSPCPSRKGEQPVLDGNGNWIGKRFSFSPFPHSVNISHCFETAAGTRQRDLDATQARRSFSLLTVLLQPPMNALDEVGVLYFVWTCWGNHSSRFLLRRAGTSILFPIPQARGRQGRDTQSRQSNDGPVRSLRQPTASVPQTARRPRHINAGFCSQVNGVGGNK